MTDVYLRLTYDQYKAFERQLEDFKALETTHVGVDKEFYHKAYRLTLGDIDLEVHGPLVKP